MTVKRPQTAAQATWPGDLQTVPPAEPGNRRAMTHGARAAITDAERAPFLERILAERPVQPVGEDHDRIAVEALADNLARQERIKVWLTERGDLDTRHGKIRPAAEYLRKLRVEGLKLLEALGMTPASRARLGLDLAKAQSFDLARHWQREDTIEGDPSQGDA